MDAQSLDDSLHRVINQDPVDCILTGAQLARYAQHPGHVFLEASRSSTLRESIQLHNIHHEILCHCNRMQQVLLASTDFLQSFDELFPSRIELHHPSIVTEAYITKACKSPDNI